MIKLQHSPTLLILLLVFFMSSCQAPKELVYKEFKNFKVGQLGFGTTGVDVDLVYYNPNNFGLQLKRTDLDVYIDNKFLGHSTQTYQITVPRRGDFSIPVHLDVDMKNFIANSLNTLFSKEVMVKVTGTVKLGKANVFKSFPVKYEGKQQFSLTP
jgi:LEA14-like dessication related protein